jgi:hypothetical protein
MASIQIAYVSITVLSSRRTMAFYLDECYRGLLRSAPQISLTSIELYNFDRCHFGRAGIAAINHAPYTYDHRSK